MLFLMPKNHQHFQLKARVIDELDRERFHSSAMDESLDCGVREVMANIAKRCTTTEHDNQYKHTTLTIDVVVLSLKEYEELIEKAYEIGCRDGMRGTVAICRPSTPG